MGGIRSSATKFVRAICFQTGDSIFRFMAHLLRKYVIVRNDVRIYQKPSSERKGDHEVVEGACVTIKIVLSSPLRTLPQSLRDSSLPEGAFEKFAAILFVCAGYFFTGRRGRRPLQKQQDLIVACRGDQ